MSNKYICHAENIYYIYCYYHYCYYIFHYSFFLDIYLYVSGTFLAITLYRAHVKVHVPYIFMSAAERLISPLAAKSTSLAYITVISGAVLLWALIGLGPYSGFNTPPQFGDFEAQRHWMEITQYLSAKVWYHYDFDWWRLDYPPLTAYHSWLCGILGTKLDPEWFALDTSRGLEAPGLKAYMRLTAIVSQIVVFLPAVWYWIKTNTAKSSVVKRSIMLFYVLHWPVLSIIDHGHFQFNSVMLGLSMAAMTALVNHRFVVGSVLFVLALFFKQMSLYYAPVVFTAILGYCLGPATGFKLKFGRFTAVAASVLITSAIMLVPFVDVDASPFYNQPGLLQILVRVFPVFRGLWEDKVANLWCTINYTVFKLKERFTPQQLQMLALAATLIAIGPSCVSAYMGKSRAWPWAFASCAWGFFLFSFQVHEKSVLIPLMPTVLASLAEQDTPGVMAMCNWACNTAYFSYWPLLKREELGLQYFTVATFSNWFLYDAKSYWPRNLFNRLLVVASYTAFLVIMLADQYQIIPEHIAARYPDLLVVLNMAGSFACFAYFWLWINYKMFTTA